jgi:UDP-N-acetylmuramate dehydrogenase
MDIGAEEKRHAILTHRLKTQPYTVPTAGCMFRNPSGHSAGQLIDSCGLKGLEVGGVRVSQKHANFFENVQNASAKNILDLVERVRYEVKKQTGIELELEVLPCFTTCTPIQQHPTGS